MFSAETGVGVGGFSGAGDIVLVPDPTTFRVLPWAPGTAWILCDLHFPDGSPVPFCTRTILRNELTTLASRGYDMTVGAELEFHVFRAEDAALGTEHVGAPGRPGAASLAAPTTRGSQLLLEEGLDRMQPLVDALYRGLTLLDLPLRSIELEFGPASSRSRWRPAPPPRSRMPSSCAAPPSGASPPASVITRPSCPARRGPRGVHRVAPAPVAHRPGDRSRRVRPRRPGTTLSLLGSAYLGGLLAHAGAAAAFTTPTVNGYKRYQPNSLAPDRIAWGIDNKGAMVRAVGGVGDPATRLGEPLGRARGQPVPVHRVAADQRRRRHRPGSHPARADHRPVPHGRPVAPASLGAAVDAFEADAVFRAALGDVVVDWYATIKRAEFARYLRHVSDWEQREYFEIF